MKMTSVVKLVLVCGLVLTPTAFAKKKGKKGKPHKEAKEYASYPWQNYSGPLQQNWFDMHDGLKNSQYVFETTKKGTVAFVGGSITGMPWRKKVMANLKKRYPDTAFNFILAGVGSIIRCQRTTDG